MVKIGGSLGSDLSGACADLAALVAEGCRVVVVHGGGAEADRVSAELGRRTRYLTSTGGRRSRYTDAPALDSLALGLLGRVKPALVLGLRERGIRAVGLCGVDGGLATARRNPPARVVVDGAPRVVRDDLAGRIEHVEVGLLDLLADGGYVPVVSPPALDREGGMLNVDADRLATEIAVALGADWLVLLSDVPGLLADPPDAASLIPRVVCGTAATDDGTGAPGVGTPLPAAAVGRMKVKVRSAVRARLAGVGNVVLADGRSPSPVLAARDGAGTRFDLEVIS